jgi:hypothetical protein
VKCRPNPFKTDMPAQAVRDREKSRADLLAEIASLPSSAFIPTAHAAAYLRSTPGVLQSWRSQRRGPRYHGRYEFIRYRISDLDQWMSARAGEISEIDNASTAQVSGPLPPDAALLD